MAAPVQPIVMNGDAADLRHEYARLAGTLATVRSRMAEIASACGSAEPVGFCAVCGAALFPADHPESDFLDGTRCGPEARRDYTRPCYYRPSMPDGA